MNNIHQVLKYISGGSNSCIKEKGTEVFTELACCSNLN
jgi:hypothetical protein